MHLLIVLTKMLVTMVSKRVYEGFLPLAATKSHTWTATISPTSLLASWPGGSSVTRILKTTRLMLRAFTTLRTVTTTSCARSATCASELAASTGATTLTS
eukprot:jgi/Mesvir1/18561/Mv25669-RA.1